MSGTSKVNSIGDLNLDKLVINASGVADVSISGSASNQKFNVSGTLNVSNFDFVTEIGARNLSRLERVLLFVHCAKRDIIVFGHPALCARKFVCLA